MPRVEKLLLYGGSFDPIHFGHLISARTVAEALQVDRVILIPTHVPPHKRDRALTPGEHRVAMCRAATADDRLFEVSDWEITQPGPSFSLRTVEHFRATHGANAALYFLIGMDALSELASWHQIRKLADLCTFVTARRPGTTGFDPSVLRGALSDDQIRRIETHIIPTPLIDICATDIRMRVAKGMSIRYLTPDVVRDYIAANGIYRDAGT